MTASQGAEARPYHHGDLRRALVDAARRILESEGLVSLSLRAVAREAGVSPAAPYHHFKDKAELLAAVATEGWAMLEDMLRQTRAATPRGQALAPLGMAYVTFARANPALYRVMCDTAREHEVLPDRADPETGGAYGQLRAALAEAGHEQAATLELDLAAIAAWSAAHGLADVGGFAMFDPLRAALGGDAAFLEGVFREMGVLAGHAPA